MNRQEYIKKRKYWNSERLIKEIKNRNYKMHNNRWSNKFNERIWFLGNEIIGNGRLYLDFASSFKENLINMGISPKIINLGVM